MSARRSRLTMLPVPAHMSQAEVMLFLKDQVFKDARDAGWIKPCARKASGRGKDSVYYATADVVDVSGRIAGGEYPGGEKQKVEMGKQKWEGRAA